MSKHARNNGKRKLRYAACQPFRRTADRCMPQFCWLNGKGVGKLSVDVAASIAAWLSARRAATRDNASREVVAVEDDFHVVGHE